MQLMLSNVSLKNDVQKRRNSKVERELQHKTLIARPTLVFIVLIVVYLAPCIMLVSSKGIVDEENPISGTHNDTESGTTIDYFVDLKDVDAFETSDLNSSSISPRQTRFKSLADSINYYRAMFSEPEIEKVRKEYWTQTFNDIRNLTGGFNGLSSNSYDNSRSSSFFSQWKLGLDEVRSLTPVGDEKDGLSANVSGIVKSSTTTNPDAAIVQYWKRRKEQRFEGFPSWERLVQDWNDEIQEYLDQVEAEESQGYALSNFGRPLQSAFPRSEDTNSTTAANISTSIVVSIDESVDDLEVHDIDSVSKKMDKLSLPKPAPAKIGQEVLPHTDISDKSKRILIVTTAALPWKTGTAVNPLLRAAYLVEGRKEVGGSITLMIPWLERIDDRERVYGSSFNFETPEDQTAYIREWLNETAKMPIASSELNITWYTAWQNKVENSIYSMGDITALVDSKDVDICILEEPEHLNWYRAAGESWTKKFPHVVGVLHTNYFSYALDQPAALIRAPAMRLLCSWMCRAHCHRIIKLSGTLDKMAPEKELVENVHGVRESFLDAGKIVRQRILETTNQNSNTDSTDPIFGALVEPKIYFIGKLLWSKGLGSLMELLKYAEESAGLKNVTVDMYGSGPDMDAADAKAQKLDLKMPFHGPLDHAELSYTHKIFVNPSTSEVLCTTSAEALAMGKFVILPSHPSNDFFVQFPNCLTYATKEEFVGNLYYAMTHSPEPLNDEYAYALSWEAATERLILASSIPLEEFNQMKEVIDANEASIEIELPAILDTEESRKARENLVTVLQNTRRRYRQFRDRLSNEVQATGVLPNPLRERLVAELDKRLDLDFDELIESPKLRIKLSPAELDKQLLEFYDNISESPSGDLLRVLGGGGQIALQNLYMKRHAERERWRKLNKQSGRISPMMSLLPSFTVADVSTDEMQRTASQWVRWSLRKNQQKLAKSIGLDSATKRRKMKEMESVKSKEDSTTENESSTVLTVSDDGNIIDTNGHNTPTSLPCVRVAWPQSHRCGRTLGGASISGWGGSRRIAHPLRQPKFSILI